MTTTNDSFKISDEDHAEGIRRRVYDAWTTSQIVDTWIKKYPQWRHIDRKKFRDASSLSNPKAKRCSAKWYELYERTLAEFRDMRGRLLEATASKASSAISDIVERVRSNATNVHIDNVHDLLHLSRVINPLKDLALNVAQEINHEHSSSNTRNINRDAVDRLLRYKDMAEELTEDEE